MTWDIDIEHVAGILSGSARIEPGLNAVRASNWQGKSSFVEAIKAGLGVSANLTEREDHGRVTMTTPERDIDVELHRENSSVTRRGDPYLHEEYDVIRTELFACLDERNEVRQTVRAGENLEGILLRPLDFQNIDQRIAELKQEREQVEAELDQAEEMRKRLPTITEKVQRLEAELADLRERRDELTGEDAETVQSTQSDLAQAQAARDRVESRIERLENSIERTEDRLEEKQAELETIEINDDDAIASDLTEARTALDELRQDIEVLQSLYSATELVLTEEKLDLVTDVTREMTGDSVVCWTCGSDVDREDVEAQLEELGERIATHRARIESRRDTVEQLEARREESRQSRRRKRTLETEIGDLEEKRADQRQELRDARETLDNVTERIDDLAESVDESVERRTDIESDIKYRETELKEARDERESLEARAERVETLTEEYEQLDEEIATLRNRKEEIKYETREAFDQAMGDILDRFDTGFESARLTPQFDLVVARDGQEASLDALSDGELELLGFVAALAGYESFDVAETVPIMLVDGVGGLDDVNLHTLIEYLQERAEYLVFTVYPEYTAFDGREIDPTAWTTTTAQTTPSQ